MGLLAGNTDNKTEVRYLNRSGAAKGFDKIKVSCDFSWDGIIKGGQKLPNGIEYFPVSALSGGWQQAIQSAETPAWGFFPSWTYFSQAPGRKKGPQEQSREVFGGLFTPFEGKGGFSLRALPSHHAINCTKAGQTSYSWMSVLNSYLIEKERNWCLSDKKYNP